MIVCPTCRAKIALPRRDGPACNCSEEVARIENGVLLFGEGYSHSIIAEHRRNLSGEKRGPRLSFDARYSEYCDAAFRAYCDPVPAPRALALGCGLGFEVMELLKRGYDAYGVEIANLAPIWVEEHGSEAWRFVLSTSGALPFEDESFDLITCFNVFEHVGTVPPDELVVETTEAVRLDFIRQAVRKLKPGGLLVLTCPNRAYPFDAGHSHHYVPDSVSMFAERGYTLADPFDERNFLPTRETVVRACQAISEDDGPVSVAFLTDAYLMGGAGPERSDPNFAARLDEMSRRWSAQTGEPIESARNPHLQAFIRKAPQMRAALDLSGQWDMTWTVSRQVKHIGQMERQAALPRFLATWTLGGTGAVESDALEVVAEDVGKGRLVLRSVSHGYTIELQAGETIGEERRWTGAGIEARQRSAPGLTSFAPPPRRRRFVFWR